MRFGKKLALRVTEDQSGAPYLSHKAMKEAINRIVRELRLYQARLATTQQPWEGGAGHYFSPQGGTAGPATFSELAELEASVAVLDQQLFSLVDSDIDRILECVHAGEAQLATEVAALQGAAMEAGVLLEESKLELFERSLPFIQNDRKALCGQLLDLRLREGLPEMAHQLGDIDAHFNDVADMANRHAQYLEINVAGFRKLLKRHEKQIPPKFHSRPTPCLRFHKLVTHTSRHLLMLVRQLRAVLADAQQRALDAIDADSGGQSVPAEAARFRGNPTELREVKGLGPECEMVVSIQKQLRDSVNEQVMRLSSTLGSAAAPMPDFYSKPATSPAWQGPREPVCMAPPQRGREADLQLDAEVPAAYGPSASGAASSSGMGTFAGYACAAGQPGIHGVACNPYVAASSIVWD